MLRRSVWWRLWTLAVILFALSASASPERDLAWARAAIARLPVFGEDRGAEGKAEQLDAIAQGVAAASYGRPRSPQEWQALELAVGFHESTFSLRIHRGDCKPKECDAGRARSAWQMHRNLFNAPLWDKLFGIEHTEVQARAASDALERAYWTCSKSGAPWLQGTINAYAGRRCSDTSWPGLEKRIATFNFLTHTPQPLGGRS